MKKVMIGILILIPIIVLLVILLVGAIISMDAYIAVESVSLEDADGNPVKTITLNTAELDDGAIVFDVNDYAYLKVLPAKATDKTVSWSIEGLRCFDHYFESISNDAAAVLINNKGTPVETNDSGKVLIRTYCTFDLKVSAGFHSASVKVTIIGYDVQRISVANVTTETNTITVGESIRLSANYTPIDSIVSGVIWQSDNAEVASVDKNGVVIAHKAGTAHITHKASVYSSESTSSIRYVSSDPYTVNVVGGASGVYGNAVTTSQTLLSLHSLGLDEFVVEGGGGTIEGDTLTVTGEQVVLKKDNQTFVVTICDDDAIAIRNEELFDYTNENNTFVLEVDGAPLTLDVVWLSQTKAGTPTGVTWSSSNTEIATVSDSGAIEAKANGIVTITAHLGSKSASIQLEAHEKVKMLSLETSNTALASAGIARETVFASDKFVNVNVDTSKEANSTLIHILGEPEDERYLVDFYSVYNFEVVEGEEYAHFDNVVANKLVFHGENLEGKGKQQVVARVSAKYPRFEAFTHYTTEEVTLNVIYGVEVFDAYEFKLASLDQKDYAYNNAVPTKDYAGFDIYVSSSKTMAIVIGDDFEFDAEYCTIYNSAGLFNWDCIIRLYGDVYGNGKTISSKKELIDGQYRELTHICWSNVTMSNIHIRVNTLDEDVTSFSANDTQTLWGDCVDIEAIEDDSMHIKHGSARLTNVLIEFSLLENGKKASSIYNSDVTYDGCVMRNMAQSGIYSPTRFRTLTIEGEEYLYPEYVHLYFNNVFASNLLGTLANITYDYYSIETYDKDGVGVPRFGQTRETIDEYMEEHYISKGYNSEFVQTGFLDLYNWQPASATNMLKTGNDDADALLQTALGALVDKHPDLEPFKYVWQRNKITESYFHMGFVSLGLNTPRGTPCSETVYLKPQLEDKRFTYFFSRNLRSTSEFPELKKDLTLGITVRMLQNLDFYIYLYDNTCEINPKTQDPESGYMPNGARLIDHLHGLV
ncbi:MAG: Ig-like domain-containing protein [Clostridia bacterium]|nr:Ig-like domain-containing protein [Clostridia bacterium]